MITPKKKRHLQLAASVREICVAVDKAIAAGPEYKNVTCKRGCAACCRMMTVITYPEAVAIVTRYPNEVERVKGKLEAGKAAGVAIGLAAGLDKGRPQMVTGDARAQLCHEWWKLQFACPFLSEENECTVYEARPLACRTYHVCSDPSLCASTPAVDVMIYTMDIAPVLALLAAAQASTMPVPFYCSDLSEMVLLARAQLRES